MQIFQKKSPSARLERNLADGRARRDKLADRLAVAELDADLRRREAITAAHSDDTAALDLAESRKRAAEDRISTLGAALQETGASIEKIKLELAAAVDQQQRSETATRLNEIAALGDDELPSIIAAMGKLGEFSELAAVAVPESAALALFSKSATDEISAAAKMIVTALRHQAQLVLDGSGPAALAEPAPAPPFTAPTPTQRVFLRYDSRWSVGRDIERSMPKGWAVDLPIEIAGRALAAGVVLAEGDPRVAELIAERGSSPYVVNLSAAVNLSADDPRPPEPVQRQLIRDLTPQERAGGRGGWQAAQF